MRGTGDSTLSSLVDSYLNLTLAEIHHFYPWTWKRRKATFSTVASQEDYALDEEIDHILLLRQRSTPLKLLYVPDRYFFELEPAPEDRGTGVPRIYRFWEETGFSTELAADDTIYVSSSSTSDGSGFKVTVVGRDTNGLVISEVLTLNGTTSVTSTATWDASGLQQVSKSAKTTGTITVYRTTGATVLSRIAPEETTPRFKKISLFPIPSAAVTMYLEYYERLRLLVNDSDVPAMDRDWLWVLREGALSKTWTYRQNEAASLIAGQRFEAGLRLMRQKQEGNFDYLPGLHRRLGEYRSVVRRYSDSVSNNFPIYGAGW